MKRGGRGRNDEGEELGRKGKGRLEKWRKKKRGRGVGEKEEGETREKTWGKRSVEEDGEEGEMRRRKWGERYREDEEEEKEGKKEEVREKGYRMEGVRRWRRGE